MGRKKVLEAVEDTGMNILSLITHMVGVPLLNAYISSKLDPNKMKHPLIRMRDNMLNRFHNFMISGLKSNNPILRGISMWYALEKHPRRDDFFNLIFKGKTANYKFSSVKEIAKGIGQSILGQFAQLGSQIGGPFDIFRYPLYNIFYNAALYHIQSKQKGTFLEHLLPKPGEHREIRDIKKGLIEEILPYTTKKLKDEIASKVDLGIGLLNLPFALHSILKSGEKDPMIIMQALQQRTEQSMMPRMYFTDPESTIKYLVSQQLQNLQQQKRKR